jgi:putative transposase
MPGVEMLEINIQVDHIHIIMVVPPKYAVSNVVGCIKGRTASMLRKKFEWLGKVYWKENIIWSPGFFVTTVGLDEKMIMNYVRHQEHQDSGQAKLVL